MIVTEKKEFKYIKNNLRFAQKIFIVGCGECATVANTGGEDEVVGMKERLEGLGKEVVGTAIPESPCFQLQVRRMLRENENKIDSSNAILVLACGIAVQNINQKVRSKLVLPGCNTLFIGTVDKKGRNFNQYCLACGDCLLDITRGYCPLTRCPKSILNGPCGGVEDEKCELEPENDCVWILIYKRLLERGEIERLKKINTPKDYSNSFSPQVHSIKEK